MKKESSAEREIQQRVIVFLNREQVDFLDKIGKDTLFSGKRKLSRTKLIASLVNFMMDLDINSQDITSIEELKRRIKERIGESWPTTRELLSYEAKKNGALNKGTKHG